MTATSDLIPPKSATTTILSATFASVLASYASTAATGSEIICKTSTPASFAVLLSAVFCSSEKFVGTVMTAAFTFLPRKSEAEEARRRIWRVVISEMGVVEGSEDGVSWMEKAMVEECLVGCADEWLGVGSMASKLEEALEADKVGTMEKGRSYSLPI
jgi:hypothetical protein